MSNCQISLLHIFLFVIELMYVVVCLCLTKKLERTKNAISMLTPLSMINSTNWRLNKIWIKKTFTYHKQYSNVLHIKTTQSNLLYLLMCL